MGKVIELTDTEVWYLRQCMESEKKVFLGNPDGLYFKLADKILKKL